MVVSNFDIFKTFSHEESISIEAVPFVFSISFEVISKSTSLKLAVRLYLDIFKAFSHEESNSIGANPDDNSTSLAFE